MVTAEELIKFEREIGDTFDSGAIRAPIHLYHGNEDIMIEIFKDINVEEDWVCCTWRNHYQGLLKGIPREVLKENIVSGKSMVVTLPEYKFICSSIVGGIPSIAAGIALSVKLKGRKNKDQQTFLRGRRKSSFRIAWLGQHPNLTHYYYFP